MGIKFHSKVSVNRIMLGDVELPNDFDLYKIVSGVAISKDGKYAHVRSGEIVVEEIPSSGRIEIDGKVINYRRNSGIQFNGSVEVRNDQPKRRGHSVLYEIPNRQEFLDLDLLNSGFRYKDSGAFHPSSDERMDVHIYDEDRFCGGYIELIGERSGKVELRHFFVERGTRLERIVDDYALRELWKVK
ncbi:hypothetical protein ACFL0X_01340 [Nanoarchaeota archaeon]